MKRSPHPARPVRPAPTILERDVAAMIREAYPTAPVGGRSENELAHDVILVVRERVLQEIESYARRNIR